MKPSTPENEKTVDEMAPGPILSFAHLSSCLDAGAAWSDSQNTSYGFPASREEDLYETGFLLKVFLKC